VRGATSIWVTKYVITHITLFTCSLCLQSDSLQSAGPFFPFCKQNGKNGQSDVFLKTLTYQVIDAD
jgi:hypothetical protein